MKFLILGCTLLILSGLGMIHYDLLVQAGQNSWSESAWLTSFIHFLGGTVFIIYGFLNIKGEK